MKRDNLLGDFWGGTAAMLVALPAAIAFGVTVYAPLGHFYAAYGAISGVLGVIAVGIITALIGGTNRLISAPSAPAAAVLSAFTLEYITKGIDLNILFVLLMAVTLLAGLFQVIFGFIGLGKLIKYMPFPVVSGYLSGVGLYIIASQLPKFLGSSQGLPFWEIIQSPLQWHWQSILIGTVTIITMTNGNKIFRKIPAVITAFIAGIGTYAVLEIFDPSLQLPNNPFVIGNFGGNGGIHFIQMFIGRFESLTNLSLDTLTLLLFPALTLAVLLSIDTLKTCIVLDSMTHSFHNSNKELIAQGTGNITSSLIGGMSGSGTMGPTMVNLSSGALSNQSGLFAGAMAVIAFGLFGNYIGWIPIAVLAGILIVIGLRMIDTHSINLFKSRKTVFDFLIIVAVSLTALTVSLIAASGVGIVLAIILYITQQIGASVVYHHLDGTEIKSKIVRNREQEALLLAHGEAFSVYELHGSLFFGTANQLYSMLQEDLQYKKYIILDMKRVQTVDLTAAHILLQIKDILHDNDGYLLLSRLPHKLPTGDDLESYFNHVELLKHLSPIKVFDDLDDAVEWVEDTIIHENLMDKEEEKLLELGDFDLFKGRHLDTLEELQSLLECRSYTQGEIIYTEGDSNGEIYLIRRGSVRLMLPFSNRKSVHLNTLGQGNFFGEFSFLECTPHYTDSIASSDTDLYRISREAFDLFSEHHKKASLHFMQSLATVLAERLRLTRSELGNEADV